MKTTSKYSQKGFSVVGIVVAIIAIVAVLAVVTMYLPKSSQNSSTTTNNQTQTSSSTVPGLDKVEGSNYVFYYPKSYTKLNKVRNSYYGSTILYYAQPSKKDTDEGISLTTQSLSTRNESPSDKYCEEGAQFLAAQLNRMLNKKPRVTEAKPIDFVKSHGCDSSLVFDDGNNHLVYNYKDLWFKEGNDFSVYSVIASYLTSDSEINSLKLSVQNFMLK